MGVPEPTLRWLVDALGTEDVEVTPEPLPDASHTNHYVVAGGRRLLLRRYTDRALADDPWYRARDEVAALRAVAASGAPVPELVAADVEATTTDVPTLLLTWLPGEPPAADVDVDELVRYLPGIHACPLVERGYEPYLVSDGLAIAELRPPRWTRDPTLWERAFEVADRPAPAFEPSFIHRDYHQGNTLFEDGRLSGIVDWTPACSGPAAIDLAHMRMNLTWAFGADVGDAFLDAWRRVGDPDDRHPGWELLDAVDWLGDGEPEPEHTPERLERFEAYVRRVLAELG